MKPITAHHRIITDECRLKGEEVAIDEALATLRASAIKTVGYWPRGKGAKFHLKLEVEYPEDGT